MKTCAPIIFSSLAACTLLGGLGMAASASVVSVEPARGAAAAALHGTAEITSSCSRAFQGLGLRLDRDIREPALRPVHTEEAEARAGAPECGQERLRIPANDLTALRGR